MHMQKLYYLFICVVLMLGTASCHKDEPEPEEKPQDRTILIYAVASNNLQSYLVSDKKEMIDAAPSVKGLGKNVRVLLYNVASKNSAEATLSELRQNATGTWDFETVRSYGRDVFSTDPKRMTQVFNDVREISPSQNYGLIFWSHGTGWIPNFSDHTVPEPAGRKRSFGTDTFGSATDYCDIHELADAIPDRMFDYIWFDACYMMGIEVAYQLRDKCNFVAGYPTEDWNPGMNYDSTLPMLATADLAGAADSFFHYYYDSDMSVTVTVARTEGLGKLAEAAAAIYAAGKRPQTSVGMQNYSRLMYGLYDFGQFTRAYLDGNGDNDSALEEEFQNALSDILVYARCSETDFNGRDSYDPEIYSGFSCHFPNSTNTSREEYYKKLDWAQATHP